MHERAIDEVETNTQSATAAPNAASRGGILAQLHRLESRFLPTSTTFVQRRRALVVVRSTLAVFFAVALDAVMTGSRSEPIARLVVPVGSVVLLMTIAMLFAVKRGYVRPAAWALVAMNVVGATYSLFAFGGIDRAVLVSPLVGLTMVVLLDGVRTGVVVSILFVLGAAISVVMAHRGLVPSNVPTDDVGAVGLLALACAFLLFVLWSYERSHREAIDESEQSEGRVSAILEASPDGIVVLDATGVVERANPFAVHVLGLSLEALRGARLESFPALAPLGSLPEGLRDITLEIDGRPPCVLEVNACGLAKRGGKILLLRDVSEARQAAKRERQLEQQLADARRLEALGRLAGGVAHDIRNMLTVILNNAEFVNETAELPSDVRIAAEEARDAALRAASVTTQLLAFARRDQGAPRAVSIDTVLDELRPMLERLVREDLVLTISTHACGKLVKADPGRLSQVFINLVANARDASRAGGCIEVRSTYVSGDVVEANTSTTPPLGSVVVEVRDEGVGMDAETTAHLFEPFFTTKPRGSGTGLGLATSYGTVAQLGGRIEVQSTLGQGSTFRVILPCVEARMEHSTEAPLPSTQPVPRSTVLVVDDEPMVLAAHARALTRQHRVLTASSGPEALGVAAREHVDILVTDMVMPGMSGRALFEQLRQQRPELPVLVLSGYTEELIDIEPNTRNLVFCSKPISPAELCQRVATLLTDRPS